MTISLVKFKLLKIHRIHVIYTAMLYTFIHAFIYMLIRYTTENSSKLMNFTVIFSLHYFVNQKFSNIDNFQLAVALELSSEMNVTK